MFFLRGSSIGWSRGTAKEEVEVYKRYNLNGLADMPPKGSLTLRQHDDSYSFSLLIKAGTASAND